MCGSYTYVNPIYFKYMSFTSVEVGTTIAA